jgi:hypothetical protein
MYPNSYRDGPPYELYGDSEMYLKWRGPLREAARLQVLRMIEPVFGEYLRDAGYTLDDAMNVSAMWYMANGSEFSIPSRIAGNNLAQLAEIFEASLNMAAIHESIDYVMPEKMRQFVDRATQIVRAGDNEILNLTELSIPQNVAPNTPGMPGPAPAGAGGLLIPIGAIIALLSFLG